MIVSIGLINKDNTPIVVKTFPQHHDASIPSPLQFLFMVHSALDHIEAIVAKQCWLGHVCPIEGYRILAYRTNTSVQIIVVVEDTFGRVGKSKAGVAVAPSASKITSSEVLEEVAAMNVSTFTPNTTPPNPTPPNPNLNPNPNPLASSSLTPINITPYNLEKQVSHLCTMVHDLYVQEQLNPFNDLGTVGPENGRFHKTVEAWIAECNEKLS